jgi:hypothetical protein
MKVQRHLDYTRTDAERSAKTASERRKLAVYRAMFARSSGEAREQIAAHVLAHYGVELRHDANMEGLAPEPTPEDPLTAFGVPPERVEDRGVWLAEQIRSRGGNVKTELVRGKRVIVLTEAQQRLADIEARRDGPDG